MNPAKTAEPIEMSLPVLTRVNQRNGILDAGTYRRHLANTVELFVHVDDAGFRYIAVATWFFLRQRDLPRHC